MTQEQTAQEQTVQEQPTQAPQEQPAAQPAAQQAAAAGFIPAVIQWFRESVYTLSFLFILGALYFTVCAEKDGETYSDKIHDAERRIVEADARRAEAEAEAAEYRTYGDPEVLKGRAVKTTIDATQNWWNSRSENNGAPPEE